MTGLEQDAFQNNPSMFFQVQAAMQEDSENVENDEFVEEDEIPASNIWYDLSSMSNTPCFPGKTYIEQDNNRW